METRKNEIIRKSDVLPFMAPHAGDLIGGQTQIHVHHHYAPAPTDTRPVEQNPGQAVLDRYTPYFIVLLGGVVILATVAVIAVMLIPALMALALAIVSSAVAVAVIAVAMVALVIAVAGAVKALRDKPGEPEPAKRGRKRRR